MTGYRQLNKILLLLLLVMTASCSNAKLGVTDARLAPCPSSPNCVSSDANDIEHQVAPFKLNTSAEAAWELALPQVRALPKTEIVTITSEYLHAECRSALFGFVDDLELHLRPAEGIIAVRSASRLGYSDLGVNRQRIETLRSALHEQKAID